jgi:hypothetical protein
VKLKKLKKPGKKKKRKHEHVTRHRNTSIQ